MPASQSYITFISRKEWTLDDLKESINNIINRNVPKDSKRTFKDALDEFIKSREGNKELARNTIKKYKTLQTHLNNFALKTNTSLRFEIINKKLFEDPSAYLRNELQHNILPIP